eukprot:4039615-Pyramimonas_sp.AAC.1
MRTLPLAPSVELPMGPRSSCEACHWRLRWNSYGATIFVRGVPQWPDAAMQTLPLAPSVELPMGPRSS